MWVGGGLPNLTSPIGGHTRFTWLRRNRRVLAGSARLMTGFSRFLTVIWSQDPIALGPRERRRVVEAQADSLRWPIWLVSARQPLRLLVSIDLRDNLHSAAPVGRGQQADLAIRDPPQAYGSSS